MALLAVLGACGESSVVPSDSSSNGSDGNDAPAQVTASDGTSSEAVIVTWLGTSNATGYRVWRDDVVIADGITGTMYADNDATPAAIAAPVLTATASTYADRVELAWTPSTVTLSTTHTYRVAARYGDGVSEPSQGDSGYRGAPPVLEYELHVDGQSMVSVGLLTQYSDTPLLTRRHHAGDRQRIGWRVHDACRVVAGEFERRTAHALVCRVRTNGGGQRWIEHGHGLSRRGNTDLSVDAQWRRNSGCDDADVR